MKGFLTHVVLSALLALPMYGAGHAFFAAKKVEAYKRDHEVRLLLECHDQRGWWLEQCMLGHAEKEMRASF